MNFTIKGKNIVIFMILLLICNYYIWALLDDNKSTVTISETQDKPEPKVEFASSQNIRNGNGVIQSWDDYSTVNLPLIASIPDEKIYLYAVKPYGVILYVKDEGCYFYWINNTVRFELPDIYFDDFDDDGRKEVAVIEHIATGTGVSWGNLHIVEILEDEMIYESSENEIGQFGRFKDNLYNRELYLSHLKKLVKIRSYIKDEELFVDISVGNDLQTLSLKELQQDNNNFLIYDDVNIGNIVRFSINGKEIKVEIPLGITSPSFAAPYYLGNIHAEIVYKEGTFSLDSISFIEDM